MASKEPDTASTPDVVARANVALVRESALALQKLHQNTGLNKTDIVNRAIQIYEFITTELQGDGQLIIRSQDGRDTQVKFF